MKCEPILDDHDRFAADSDALVAHLDQYVTQYYGTRCDEFEPDCPVCKFWKWRDDIADHVS